MMRSARSRQPYSHGMTPGERPSGQGFASSSRRGTFLVLAAFALQVFLAAAWNVTAWGDMIGRAYFAIEHWDLGLFLAWTLLTAIVPSTIGTLAASWASAMTEPIARGFSVAVVLLASVSMSHAVFFWQVVRPYCCSA